MSILATIDALNRELDSHPEAHDTRRILADALEDAGGELAELAPGYRALGVLRKRPGPGHVNNVPKEDAERFWENEKSQFGMPWRALPRDWFVKLDKGHQSSNTSYPSRRAAEDAAALAFARLPESRRAELLATEPQEASKP